MLLFCSDGGSTTIAPRPGMTVRQLLTLVAQQRGLSPGTYRTYFFLLKDREKSFEKRFFLLKEIIKELKKKDFTQTFLSSERQTYSYGRIPTVGNLE